MQSLREALESPNNDWTDTWLPGQPAGPDQLPRKGQPTTYMKFAVCHQCNDVISAGIPTIEQRAAGDMNFHRCSCKSVAFAYAPNYPDSHSVAIMGPANILAVLDDEWQAAVSPDAGNGKRLFITFMTVPRNATTIIDLDVDPDDPQTRDGKPTHFNNTTLAPVVILVQTDRELTIKYVNTGVQYTVSRLKFYENYSELPGEEVS